jgi:hypothetical protein
VKSPGLPLFSSLRKKFKAAKTIVERSQGVARARSRPWSSRAIDNLKAHGVSVDDKYLPKYAQRTWRTQSILASVES